MDATFIICTLIICVTVLTIFYMLTTKGIQFHNFNRVTHIEDPSYYTPAVTPPTTDKEIEEQMSEAFQITQEIHKLFLDPDQLAKEDKA